MSRRLFRLCALLGAVLATTLSLAGNVLATAPDKHAAGQDALELARGLDDFIGARTAPNTSVDPRGYLAAVTAAAALPATKGSWTEVGPYNYFTDDPNYTDPNFSNSGSGDRYVSGRITALAASDDGGVVIAGGADGGLWRSTNGGAKWSPTGDQLASLSIGSLAYAGGGVFLAGSGEANTNSDSYAGVGIYRSADFGKSWTRIGPDQLVGALIWRIRVDPNVAGQVWAATSKGVYMSTDSGLSWTLSAAPVVSGDFVGNQYTDIAIQPGTQTIVAVKGWRNGDPNNGFYVSRDGGQSFSLVANPQGWVPLAQQGRVSLSYSGDGSQLYAIDEDPTQLVDASKGVYTALGGVFSAKGGDPAGPWNQIADSSKLMNSGSAMRPQNGMKGYQPGVQAWYNQVVTVDPANANHVYIGLEEVYETQDGGSSWTTIAPYWNLTLPCFSYSPFEGTCNKNGAHSDQHAAVIAGGTVFIGNDGGVYSKSLADHSEGNWADLNQTLGTLQFYSASAGQGNGLPLTYWGGLQDNGTARVAGGAANQPFGGDGGTTYVDPGNPDNVITEYVDLQMAKSTNGGHSWTSIAPPDPSPRFIAPFGPDQTRAGHLVAGGRYVWTSGDGFATTTWTQAGDAGAGHSITALSSANDTVYAGWCGPCNPHMSTADLSSASFHRGVITNAGGSWHSVAASGLPNRYLSGISADPANPLHAYASVSGYSRNWIVGPNDPGTGHVFETVDGGNSWADISSNLIDGPVNSILVTSGHIVAGTDAGAFVSTDLHGSSWQRLGSGLPNVVVDQLTLTPAGTILAATHGRGLWTIPISSL